MSYPPFDPLKLDSDETMTIAELSRASGLSTFELAELVDYGAITPLISDQEETIFYATCIDPLRKVCRLRVDYDLDLFTLAVIMGYLNRIEELERQISAIEAIDGISADSL